MINNNSTLFRKTLHIILVIFLLLGAGPEGLAQPGFYIPQQGKIFFNGDTATIFSNVQNGGKLGVGKNAVVNFKGDIWENEPQSLLTDESQQGEGIIGTGGLIRFLATDTLWQWINGGYNAAIRAGPGFPNLQIQNRNGVRLIGSTTKVRNELRLTDGLVYLDNNILVIGNEENAGKITGFDSARYIVTGNAPGMGLLVRENVRAADDLVIFPVGTRPHQYTPAAIRTRSLLGDDFYVAVFDSVRAQAVAGALLKEASVNKTWEIGKRFRPNEEAVEVLLQHLIADEGAVFNAGRPRSYISQFTNGGWDTASPFITPQAGYLSTGPLLSNAGVNARTLNGAMPASAYYTKFTGSGDPGTNRTRVWLSGYRINDQQVKVYWTTKPEINNNYFVVQRRFSHETNFTNIDTMASKAPNGNSEQYLNYELNDPNNYAGITYYRLMLVDFNGRETFSTIVPVGRMPGVNQALVWPNPSNGRFFVGISTAMSVKSIVIWNTQGQKLKEEAVNNRSVIEMYLPIQGAYFVGFVAPGGNIVATQKLLIKGYD